MRFTTGSRFGSLTRCAAIMLACMAASTVLVAQTSSSGSIIGTVTDPTGAVVPRATVTLVNPATNASTSVTTNDTGQYVFAGLTPGTYRVSVTAQGFSTATLTNVGVQVNQSLNVPVQLTVGTPNETVEVQATAAAQLQTVDAQIGNVLTRDSVDRLPTLRRDATELFSLQPGTSPGTNNTNFIRVTGALEDQNTITLDGIDVTENIVGTNNGGTAIPLPAMTVEEFRVNVANPNATVNRSSGGQINLVGRGGSNTFHGRFDYFQQDDQMNANDWANNHLGVARPAISDHRYSGAFSGPVWKNKTFFFGAYEGRRFGQAFQITRLVPTDSLKAGILKFKDAAGSVVSYDLKSSTACAGGACDPRGLGISPTIKNLWNRIAPGNDATLGDNLNLTGYRGNVATPIKNDYYFFRLDHNFNQMFKFNGNYTYYRLVQTGSNQVDITGSTPKSTLTQPQHNDLISGILTMNLNPNFLNVVRFGTVRNRTFSNAEAPSVVANLLQVPGTSTAKDGPVALLAGFNAANTGFGLSGMSPIDVDTQRARFQASLQRSTQFVDDATWIHGNHTVAFGGSLNLLWLVHIRADKVVGSLTSLAATADAGLFLNIPSSSRPAPCGGNVRTNCLQTADQSQWDRLYAASLGLVDNIGIMMVRDGNLNPLPFGTLLANDTLQKAYNFYGQDTWRLTPNLTLTYGLAYGWQTAPTEKLHRQTIEIDATTGKPLTAETYLANRLAAAQQGQIYNPTIGYLPVGSAHRPVFNTDYGDWAPRAAIAWNPSPKGGLLGSVFGDHKTVLRGGFSLVYDRTNTVQSVLIPMLGVGFAQNITLQTPACNSTGAGGTGCSAGNANPALGVFRIGVDGTVPVPVVPAASNPVIPPAATNASNGYTESLSFQVDPDTKIGRSYNFDFSIQREIPGGLLLEAAYAGRFGRHLEEAVNLAQVPYMMKDSASGQTFAQAFDAIATALRAGASPTAVPAQPFFENQFKGLALAGSANATQFFASRFSSNFVTGLVSNLVQQMSRQRRSIGLQPFVNDQVLDQHFRTFAGQSNYNGLLVTVQKRTSHGLTFTGNYTWSRALDWTLINQNQAGEYSNSFFPNVEYGPSTFDRTHVFNLSTVYDLPFGNGKRFATGNFLDRIIGGWYMSNIFSTWTGLPLIVVESGQAWGGGPQFASNTSAIPAAAISSGFNSNVAGSNGIGTGPSKLGTGINLFSDPAAVYNGMRRILLSSDTRSGRGQAFRGLGYWNLDSAMGKSTKITERVSVNFRFDFFNTLNHVNFADPGSLNLQGSPTNFGVISSEFTPPARSCGCRWIQFGAGVTF